MVYCNKNKSGYNFTFEQTSKFLRCFVPQHDKRCFVPQHDMSASYSSLSLNSKIIAIVPHYHCENQYIAAFDVDLIPISDTLLKHLEMAQLSPQLLITGYRVMSDLEMIDDLNTSIDFSSNIITDTYVAPEDKDTALWKHLIRKERFGVVPLFERQRLLEIGGWDEKFIGWGGEDQDIIERYLESGRYLCRSPELVYVHLSHPPNPAWNEPHLVEENRKHYYNKMQSRNNM